MIPSTSRLPVRSLKYCRPIPEPETHAAPIPNVHLILRLDETALVVDAGPRLVGSLISGVLFCLPVILVMWKWLWVLPARMEWVGLPMLVAQGLSIAVLVMLMLGTGYLLRLGWRQMKACPVTFNRREGMVYGQSDGQPFALKWSTLQPWYQETQGKGRGIVSLLLVERDTSLSADTRQQRGRFIAMQGYYTGWQVCQHSWAFLQTYMEGAPEALPAVELIPAAGPRWVSLLLEYGPYGSARDMRAHLKRLRQHQGEERLGLGWCCYLALSWPGIWLQWLHDRLNPDMPPRLTVGSAQLLDPPVYQLQQANAEDERLRQQLARRVRRHMIGWSLPGILIWWGWYRFLYHFYSIVH